MDHYAPHLNLATLADIDRQFAKYKSVFSGKETEQNWQKRDDALNQMTELMAQPFSTEVHLDLWFYDSQLVKSVTAHVAQLMDQLLIAANSLRTTLSISACAAISASVTALKFDAPVTESIVVSIAKLLASTKKLVLASASQCLTTVLLSCTVNKRIADKVGALADDKNPQVRQYSMLLIYELLLFATNNPSSHSDIHFKFFDVWKVAILHAVVDQTPKVRQAARDCADLYKGLDSALYHLLVSKFDTSVRKLLVKDPHQLPTQPSLLSDDSIHQILKSLSNPIPFLSDTSFKDLKLDEEDVFHDSSSVVNAIDDGQADVHMLYSLSVILELSHIYVYQPSPTIDDQCQNQNSYTADDQVDLELWLATFQDAINGDSINETTAIQCLTYIIHTFNQAVGKSSLAENDGGGYHSLAPFFRKAILLAMGAMDNSLALIALDDPGLLWTGFSLSPQDATSLIVSLAECSLKLGIIIEPMVTECHNEALWSVYGEQFDVWIELLSGALDSVLAEETMKILAEWVRMDVPSSVFEDWVGQCNGTERKYQLAQRVLRIEQLGNKDPKQSGVGPQELDPIEDLVLAVNEHRLTIVELYRYSMHVKTRTMSSDLLMDHIARLLTYSTSVLTHQPAPGIDPADVSVECVITVNALLVQVNECTSNVLQLILDHAQSVTPTSPLAHWYTQCVQSLIAVDPQLCFTRIVLTTADLISDADESDPPYALHLSFLLIAMDSLDSPITQISQVRTPLESVIRISIQSRSSYTRLVSVKLLAGLSKVLGNQFLDQLVPSCCLEPVHLRLVKVYADKYT